MHHGYDSKAPDMFHEFPLGTKSIFLEEAGSSYLLATSF